MKTILVIGSNSFTGAHYCRECIKRGYNVIGISRSAEPPIEFLPYKWDKKDIVFEQVNLNHDEEILKNIINKYKPEYVVNFASQGMVAQSWRTPEDWYQTNVVAQVKLHDILRQTEGLEKYVHISTPEVYGSSEGKWQKENENYKPSTPYAVSRAACDLHLKSFLNAYNFPVVFTRAANVYGPGQQLYRIMPKAILCSLTGARMQLHGGGKSKRSFVYIDDTVRATRLIMERANPGSIWHISTNEIISIKELVMRIFKRTGGSFEKCVEVTDERLGKDDTYLLKTDKLRIEMEWKDECNLEAGIDKTIIWVRENLNSLIKMSWEYSHKK
ncbi:GDP-mannose 4,6-dehydratase [Synechococcus sp. A15-28]|uniref:GDP-mannose 4,6-dehydratase n=1 Tax=Synechococcus sp. A15-28 TaxID=1050638 RepID=UPI00164963BE|nr:GDP-mannose 4,6-dehydratase [Synechococcus sp. A15-28]QNI41219.1 NAD dependent epimerase/dehydratase family protein [Synechococcus sp. A15-28]